MKKKKKEIQRETEEYRLNSSSKVKAYLMYHFHRLKFMIYQDDIRFNTSTFQVGHLLPGKELRTPRNQTIKT